MFTLYALCFFALGAIIASFIGVLSARLHTGQSFLVGRSRCDACDAELPSAVLIPIFSYVAYRGCAACCGTRLSSASPVTEILLGILFVFAYHALGLSIALPFVLLSLALLLALVLYDLAHQILPSGLLGSFVGVSALAGFFATPLPVFQQNVLIALLIGGSLALVHFLSRGKAMGFADAPLAFGLALLTGAAALSGFVFSFWIGAVIGIVLLLNRPKGSRMGVEVPFAPFLAAGFLLAYFTQWNPFLFVTVLAAFH